MKPRPLAPTPLEPPRPGLLILTAVGLVLACAPSAPSGVLVGGAADGGASPDLDAAAPHDAGELGGGADAGVTARPDGGSDGGFEPGPDAGPRPERCWYQLAPGAVLLGAEHDDRVLAQASSVIVDDPLLVELGLNEGMVLVGTSTVQPFLRRVTRIDSDDPRGLRLETEPAGLADAFRELHVDSSCTDLGRWSLERSGWISLSASAQPRLDVNVGLLSARSTLAVEFDGALWYRLDLGFGRVRRLELIFDLESTATLDTTIAVGQAVELGEVELLDLEVPLGPPIAIGPLVLQPVLGGELELEVEAEGTASIELRAARLLELTGSIGVRYDGVTWTRVNTLAFAAFSNVTGAADLRPQLSGNVSFTLEPPLALGVRVLGIGGAELEVGPYAALELSAPLPQQRPPECRQGSAEIEYGLVAALELELDRPYPFEAEVAFAPLGLGQRGPWAFDLPGLCCGDGICSGSLGEHCGSCGDCGCASSAPVCSVDRCVACPANACQDRDLTSGSLCDGDTVVSCGFRDPCAVESARQACPSGQRCEAGACVSPPAPTMRELTVTVSGSGRGRVSSSPSGIDCTAGTCNASYTEGTTVTLTASPTGSDRFGGWTGACSGTSPSCTVTLSAALSVGARFDPPPLTPRVSVNPSSGPRGTTFDEPGTGFTPGGAVTLHFVSPTGLDQTVAKTADASGAYAHSYTSHSGTELGQWRYYAVDGASDAVSNSVFFTVTAPAEVCNGVDDDGDGVIDDDDACWVAVYRLVDRALPSDRQGRCYTTVGNGSVSHCPGFVPEFGGPVFFLYRSPQPGTVALYAFDSATDHILTEATLTADLAFLRNPANGFTERGVIGWLGASTTSLPGGRYPQMSGANTDRVRQLRRYSHPQNGVHLYANNPAETAPGWNSEGVRGFVWGSRW